jgi:hypothetical protein
MGQDLLGEHTDMDQFGGRPGDEGNRSIRENTLGFTKDNDTSTIIVDENHFSAEAVIHGGRECDGSTKYPST